MTASFPSNFNPYETRLELRCNGGLLALSSSIWEKSAALCGARVVSTKTGEGFRSYILSLSSLFVFDNVVILICCSQSSYDDLFAFWMKELAVCQPHLLLREKRSEAKDSEESVHLERMIPWGGCSDSSIQWRHRTNCFTPAALTPPSPISLNRNLLYSIVRKVLRGASLFCIDQVHLFTPIGFSSNHVFFHDGNLIGYVTLHYSEALYLSVESGWIGESEDLLQREFFISLSSDIQSYLVDKELCNGRQLTADPF